MRCYRFHPPDTGESSTSMGRDRASGGWRRAGWRLTVRRTGAILVAGSGILNLTSLVGSPAFSAPPYWVRDLFPLAFVGLSRSLTLLAGFALVLAAIHLWAGKRRAWQLAQFLAAGSAIFHLGKGWDVEDAICSAALAMLLWLTRHEFPVGAGRLALGVAVRRAALAFAITGIYGAAGFWLLEPKEFHHNFHWWEAAIRTMRLMLFLGDQSLVPRTPYAAWFLDSISWMSAAAFLYSGIVLFRPVAYRFRFNSGEAALAQSIAAQHGRTGQDFFKHWPDKSYYFSPSGRSFLAYRVAGSYALVLGDPVGPDSDFAAVVTGFVNYCAERGWAVGFYQVGAQFLKVYESLGFRKLKVGDDAIVDLAKFSLSGSSMKEFRNTVNRLDRLDYRVERVDPPLTEPLFAELKRISDSWLEIPGHRERQFTLGCFEPRYVRSTPVYVAYDGSRRPVAFLNLVPSYDPLLATVDLMRRSRDHVNGLMDYLFAKVFLDLKDRGIRRFSLGMAPLSGEAETIPIDADERALRWVLKRVPFLFRADSLRRFKAKYADEWEPRFAVYHKRLDLPRMALAVHRVSERRDEQRGVA